MRRQSARDEERERERERERVRERERERERNRESVVLRGSDAGGYWRDDKGRKDGPLDPTKDERYIRKSEREAFERQKAEKDAKLEDRGRGKDSRWQDRSRDRIAHGRPRDAMGTAGV